MTTPIIKVRTIFAQLVWTAGRPAWLSARYAAYDGLEKRMHGWGGTIIWEDGRGRAVDRAMTQLMTSIRTRCGQIISLVDEWHDAAGGSPVISQIDLARNGEGVGLAIYRSYPSDPDGKGQLLLEQDGSGVLRLNNDTEIGNAKQHIDQIAGWLSDLDRLVTKIRRREEE